MMPPKCYTWLESCGSHLSDGKNEKLFVRILQSVGFSMTLCTDIFLNIEKLSYRSELFLVSGQKDNKTGVERIRENKKQDKRTTGQQGKGFN